MIKWFRVSLDEARIHLQVKRFLRRGWSADIAWDEIVRVCFKAEDFTLSDGIYLFVRGRPESYAVPVEAVGGQELLEELIRRELFPADLAIRAAVAPQGVFCWPGDQPRQPIAR